MTIDVVIKKSGIGQFSDGFGAFANRNFRKGEVVIKWKLKILTEDEHRKLPEYDRENFTHKRDGIIHLYSEPERHVNKSKNPNVIPDFEKNADVALRDITKGEELSISITTVEDF